MTDIYIKSLTYYLPEDKLSNQDLLNIFGKENAHFDNETREELVYNYGRKFDFLGIKSRSFCRGNKDNNILTMAIAAADQAIKKANLSDTEINSIIVSGVTNPYREPAFSTILARQLGIETCDYFDINDTCNGFMKSIEIAGLYLQVKNYRNILLVTSESPYEIARSHGMSFKINDPEEADNKLSGFIVGSGSAAMVLSREKTRKKILFYQELKKSNNWQASVLTLPGIPVDTENKKMNGFWSDARLISSSIIREMPEFIINILAEWDLKISDINAFILHQLGNNVTFATLEKLGVSHDKAPVNTFNDCGNMATANIPVNLAMADEKGLIKNGDKIILLSSACGFTYSIACLEW